MATVYLPFLASNLLRKDWDNYMSIKTVLQSDVVTRLRLL